MEVSTQLGNLSGNQLLLLLNLGSFELFSVDPVCPKFNITVKLKKIFVEVWFIISVRPRTKIMIFIK